MYTAIVFLPLIGALITGFFGRTLGIRASQIVTTSLLFVSSILSWIAFFDISGKEIVEKVLLSNWIVSGDLDVQWSLRIDMLTGVMLVVITSISTLVHLYSAGYMSGDPSQPRFFSYLSLFTFMMLMLVTSDNLVQMFFGWEGVGLASYLLIGYYYKKDTANAAAMKAFIVNRVGDFGYALGIFGIFAVFGSVQFDDIFAQVSSVSEENFSFLGYDLSILNTLCMLLFIGAMGKSAQLFLHTWLPDAMEGPTPVSALIHAATMVTAGVFLVCRMSPLFEYAVGTREFITIIGASTAFFAATIGLVQNDIKRVIAYSTCSQLGYMFFAAGIGAYQAAMFHLFTHAFFKALLFLGAGSVIHAMHYEQDMRRMGGLWRKIPLTYTGMIIGTLAITGFGIPTVIGLSGYYSKDLILESAFAAETSVAMYAFVLGGLAAIMTAFYSWRLIFMTFHGKSRAEPSVHNHAHESPLVMTLPLVLLSIGAIAAGFIFEPLFVGYSEKTFWAGSIFTDSHNHVLHDAHSVPLWVKFTPFIAGIIGFVIAYIFYISRPSMPKKLAGSQYGLYNFLLNKWYFDTLYKAVFILPAMWIGKFLWKRGDGNIIDGFINGLSGIVIPFLARKAGKAQSGYIFHYATAMITGLTILITWYSIFGKID